MSIREPYRLFDLYEQVRKEEKLQEGLDCTLSIDSVILHQQRAYFHVAHEFYRLLLLSIAHIHIDASLKQSFANIEMTSPDCLSGTMTQGSNAK